MPHCGPRHRIPVRNPVYRTVVQHLWAQTQDSGPAPIGTRYPTQDNVAVVRLPRHRTLARLPRHRTLVQRLWVQDSGLVPIKSYLWRAGGLTISPPNGGYCDLGIPAEPGGAQRSRSTAPQIRNPWGAKIGVTYTLSQCLYRHNAPEVYYNPGRWTYI